MNNKEFIAELAQQTGFTVKDTTELIAATVSVLTQHLQEDDTVAISGFGSFEVRKKAERISVNPSSKQRMLIPPKLVLTFKPSTILKSKFKSTATDE